MNNTVEMTQLKVWIPLQDKLDFQVACLKAGSNMTIEIGDLIRQFLRDKKGA